MNQSTHSNNLIQIVLIKFQIENQKNQVQLRMARLHKNESKEFGQDVENRSTRGLSNANQFFPSVIIVEFLRWYLIFVEPQHRQWKEVFEVTVLANDRVG